MEENKREEERRESPIGIWTHDPLISSAAVPQPMPFELELFCLWKWYPGSSLPAMNLHLRSLFKIYIIECWSLQPSQDLLNNWQIPSITSYTTVKNSIIILAFVESNEVPFYPVLTAAYTTF